MHTYFQSDQDSQWSFSASTKPDRQGSARTQNCLPDHIPVHNTDWFTCHFWQLYFKADWSEIHFLFMLLLPFYAFVFTLAENMSNKRSTAKPDENIIIVGERSIKAAEKDPSTTVVISIRLTGATVVGSVNATEFWQRLTQPSSFLLLEYCSVAKWILQFHSDRLFTLAAK